MSGRSFLGGVAVGAGLTWMLDPERGAARRAELRRRVDGLFGTSPAPLAPIGAGAGVRTRSGDIAELGAHAYRVTAAGRRLAPKAALTTAAGGAIALFGLTRRGLTGRAMRAAGTSMVAAGLRGIEARAGIERRRAFDVQRTIDVGAPPDRAFAFWGDLGNFPRLMPDVRSVHELGGGRSRWTVDTGHGGTLAWVTALSALVPGRLVAWASEPGSAVRHAGAVRVSPRGSGSRIAVRLCYAPEGPAGEAAVAALLGSDPLASINKVFERAKALLDHETTGRPARP